MAEQTVRALSVDSPDRQQEEVRTPEDMAERLGGKGCTGRESVMRERDREVDC